VHYQIQLNPNAFVARPEMIVQYTTDTEQSWLRAGAEYAVQAIYFDPDQGVRYRIISDDAATPALFVASAFTVIDGRIPESWRAHAYSGGSFVVGPVAWQEPGFWERLFDGDTEARRLFDINTIHILE